MRTNVLPKLPPPSSQLWRRGGQIREDLEEFFGIDGDEPIELWAWVAPMTMWCCASCGGR